MTDQYEEMVKESAEKIRKQSIEDLLDNLYGEIQKGNIPFNLTALEEAVAKTNGEDGAERLGIKIENIYAVLKYRLAMPDVC